MKNEGQTGTIGDLLVNANFSKGCGYFGYDKMTSGESQYTVEAD